MPVMIKICGMREAENIREVSELKPDLLGFIFYRGSQRYAGEISDPDIIAGIQNNIKKTGVFVNSDFNEIIFTVGKYSLDTVQLHGNETPDECNRLKEKGIRIIKAFSIKESKDFRLCNEYVSSTDYFLFDTFNSKHGGSGQKFDWRLLDNYNLDKPFFLSGGISPGDISKIMEITNNAFAGVDLNSRFEIKPGLKDIETLKKFISDLRLHIKSL
jgi:phosphoribosylanthranilate isomerase